MELKQIRISARISDLARLQAFHVGGVLKKKFPRLEIIYNFRKSLGDINLQDPLWKMPEKGVFTQDFLKDLTEETTDLVVHSWKDLPTEKSPRTEIIATLPRADQRDLLLFKKSALNTTAVKIFSSSPRREYNLTACLPTLLPWKTESLEFLPVRGNVQTRVRKWKEDPQIHGLVVAKAAMDRLLLDLNPEFAETKDYLNDAIKNEKWMVLPLSLNPTAAAQGALAIEILSSRTDLKELLLQINDAETFQNVERERKILKSYGGGCHQKIGISVVKKDFGFIQSLRGLTDGGETLLKWETTGVNNPPKFSVDELGTIDSTEITRKEINTSQPTGATKALFVSRADAWPSAWKPVDQVIWSAGVQTWKKMAQIGVWVNGTTDGLGEEIPFVNHLQGTVEADKLEWYKLTHNLSEVPTRMKKLETYEVRLPKDRLNELKGKKMIYWKSSSQYRQVMDALAKTSGTTNIEFHSCGPGSTYEFLKTQVDVKKLFVFLSENEWLEKCRI